MGDSLKYKQNLLIHMYLNLSTCKTPAASPSGKQKYLGIIFHTIGLASDLNLTLF